MKVVEKAVKELKPYKNNPRNNEGAIEFVANSIKEFGFKVPVIIDKDNVIVAGHTRLKAALELGLETIPCIVADDLTEEQTKAFRIADNKVADQAYWNYDILGEEMRDIVDTFDMQDFGFGDFEISLLLDDLTPDPFDKEIEEQYAGHEEQFLNAKRIIITYTDENEAALADLIGVETIDRVSYKAEELINE